MFILRDILLHIGMEGLKATLLAETEGVAEGESALLTSDFGPFFADKAVKALSGCGEGMRFSILKAILMFRFDYIEALQLVIKCIIYKVVFAFWQHGIQSQKIKIKCK